MHDDEGAGGGCLTVLIIGAIIAWLSDNWETILLVIVAIIAIIALIAGIRSYNAKAPEREAAAKTKAEKEAQEKRDREEASYKNYFRVVEGSDIASRLKAANVILKKLYQETDPDKRTKILAFFDKYLPLMTEIVEASKHGDTDTEDSVKRFTETVKAFSRSLYRADDVIDVNKAAMESMAIRDGLYDPYAADFGIEADSPEEDEEVDAPEDIKTDPVMSNERVAHQEIAPQIKVSMETVRERHRLTEEDVEQAIQDKLEEALLFDDFDTIRDMLDSGVLSEYDLDDDVLQKVEDWW